MSRTFIIGDLHGHLKELEHALKRVEFDYSNDKLIAVGDLIDRGPNSVECLRLLNEDWFTSVRGNHEQMLLEAIGALNMSEGDPTPLLNSNQFYHWADIKEVRWFFDLARRGDLDTIHELEYLIRDMPYMLDYPNFRVAHANPHEDGLAILWDRTPAKYARLALNCKLECLGTLPNKPGVLPGPYNHKLCFVGHDAMPFPFHHNGTIFMDTGAGYITMSASARPGTCLSILEITHEMILDYSAAVMDPQVKVWQPSALQHHIDLWLSK